MMKQDKNWFYWNDLPNRIPEDISGLTDEEKNGLVKEWKKAVWTKSTQEVEQKLKNIRDLPALRIIVEEWVMDRLKEAADHYVNGLWLSSIALCESTCEFLSIYLLEKYISSKGIDKVIENALVSQNQYTTRLGLLRDLSIISEKERKLLDEIRKIRNKYIHLNKIDFIGGEIKKDSLISIKNLIEFLNHRTLK